MLRTKSLLARLVISMSALNALAIAAHAEFWVTNWTSGTVGEYTSTGGTVNAAEITGLNNPAPIAVNGSTVLVVSFGSGTLGAYQVSNGAVINSTPALITGLNQPRGITAANGTFYVTSWTTNSDGKVGKYTLGSPITLGSSNPTFLSGLSGGPNGVGVTGNRLFVENATSGVVAEYDATTGAAVNTSLLTIPGSQGFALSGNDLYVTSFNSGSYTVGKYLLGGSPGTISTVNSSLITGSGGPMAIAVDGSDLFLDSFGGNKVLRYDTSGTLLSSNLVGTLGGSVGLATPEPASLALLGIGAGALLLRRKRSQAS